MNIEIKPEDIDKIVKDAILNSSLGSIITDIVKECLDPRNIYRSGMVNVIESVVRETTKNILRDQHYDKLVSAINEGLEKKLTPKYFNKIVDKVLQEIMD
jgi:hypothetical protein